MHTSHHTSSTRPLLHSSPREPLARHAHSPATGLALVPPSPRIPASRSLPETPHPPSLQISTMPNSPEPTAAPPPPPPPHPPPAPPRLHLESIAPAYLRLHPALLQSPPPCFLASLPLCSLPSASSSTSPPTPRPLHTAPDTLAPGNNHALASPKTAPAASHTSTPPCGTSFLRPKKGKTTAPPPPKETPSGSTPAARPETNP